MSTELETGILESDVKWALGKNDNMEHARMDEITTKPLQEDADKSATCIFK